ncbi:hypothetical protein [Prochlorococcus sp. MIT 1223]|uniref:DUF7326 family protein n=1 Tax=Prochlorococcus sp. MIT 1223 TaxID=3096217 RepID=UPI002A75C89F|nr:hypothetical protein [Prochlorococcus sp. MIT 1223]
MSTEQISYKDLSKKQLENLKERYIDSRIESMTEDDLRKFVRSIVSDQITGTVGNAEEREAWKEMKEHFKDSFELQIKEVINMDTKGEDVDPEKIELERRLDLLEKRKKEKDKINDDMW